MSEVKCPKCGRTDKQNKKGLTAVGSQRCFCNICHYKYTPERKKWVYTEKQRKQALQLLMLGYSGRAVGKALGMSKSNVYRWAIEEGKKSPAIWISPQTDCTAFDLGELFWFTNVR